MWTRFVFGCSWSGKTDRLKFTAKGKVNFCFHFVYVLRKHGDSIQICICHNILNFSDSDLCSKKVKVRHFSKEGKKENFSHFELCEFEIFRTRIQHKNVALQMLTINAATYPNEILVSRINKSYHLKNDPVVSIIFLCGRKHCSVSTRLPHNRKNYEGVPE